MTKLAKTNILLKISFLFTFFAYRNFKNGEFNLETNEINKKLLALLGNQKGTMRQIDGLGRIVIPAEYREQLNLSKDDFVEMCLFKNAILLLKSKNPKSK